MRYNIGSVERLTRVVLGLGILLTVFIGPASPWGYLGLILIATGLFGWCPILAILSTSTCDKTGSCPPQRLGTSHNPGQQR